VQSKLIQIFIIFSFLNFNCIHSFFSLILNHFQYLSDISIPSRKCTNSPSSLQSPHSLSTP
jgi:hypothetical protein